MRAYLVTLQASFTVPVFCWIYASLYISLDGALTCQKPPPSPVSSVQELVHRSGVVIEGKLQEEGRENDTSEEGREIPIRQRDDPDPNSSEVAKAGEQVRSANEIAGRERYQVRVRVHQVWQVKAGGLQKDSVVSIIWNLGENCLKKDTRYMFFMDPTNDTSVFNAVFPPVETRKNVRMNASKLLCHNCVEPKLKEIKSMEVQEGKRALLKCETRTKQKIDSFNWYKDGKEFAGKNKPKSVKIKVNKNRSFSELRFRKTTEAHAGSYRCEAVNSVGKSSTMANLTVIKAVTSTTPPVRTSSHEKYCPESQKNYCVNGGTCFTIQVTPGTNKLLCRCLPGFSGNRCQDIVPMKVMNQKQAEELYQKRVLTITGICIALLVVGIMCVVAYCKTKKQRKKLQDRLRQSVRNERSAMPGMANGPQMHSQAPESIQLANQYASKNPIPAEHTIEKETSFSASQYTSSAQNSTAVTHSCSQSWSNGRGEGVLSDSRSGPVASSMENSRNITPGSRRGRLNATGCARDLNVAYLNNPRETPDSYKDSPYSERYVSAMTTPTRISPVELPCPASPKSPPSEMSAPLSSLAMSVPSVAVSPQGEEECPLLFTTPPRLRDKQRQDHAYSNGNQYQRSSAHYNHGLEANSTPPSPQRTAEDDDYETTPEYETTVPQASKKVTGSRRASRAKVNGHVAHKPESKSDSSSESSSSESETEDERVGEDTPFLSIQNPLAVSLESATSCRPSDSSRTNPALRLSAQEDLQARLSSVIVNQDPIAV
ncbi:pro-neuregulin-1, membrane-bound isoform isoform X4 [Paramormyrops kingsleyae]|uniref:Pro-neuregulin-1, membrane-bound isoform n=1 Tax=Paramormyrops kingsleyae TaxID=1676925 RepID=A0A3B3QYI4_9TELE